MAERIVGPLVALAVKLHEGGPMREVDHATARLDAGLTEDIPHSIDRGLTLISSRQWAAVTRTLGADLPWHTRRANLLIDADRLGDLIGLTCRLGDVEILVTGETRPCGLMDKQFPGLREALIPECRGGVTARVVRGGALRRGDVLIAIG